MLEARKRMLEAALSALAGPVAVWCEGDAQAAADPDLVTLLSLQPLLALRKSDARVQGGLPPGRYPAYGMSLPQEARPRGNRFLGFPTGFSLDAFVDELVALSRGARLASPLARETLSGLARPVHATVLTSPG
jgi:hypothetical protein